MDAEIKKLQGTWNVVALEVEGQQMEPAIFTGSKIVVKGERFTTIAMGATYNGTLAVDATKTPKNFDLIFTEGPEKGNTSYGIYELSKDTWKICLTVTAKARPRKFATAPGSGLGLETLQREKQSKPQPHTKQAASKKSRNVPPDLSSTPSGRITGIEGEWKMVSCIRDGYPLEKSMVKMGRRVATGNVTTTLFGSQVFMKASYTLDPSKQPNCIDYVLTHGPSAGATQLGIYELKGKTVTFCFSAPSKPRPTGFASVEGDGRTLTVWSLSKK